MSHCYLRNEVMKNFINNENLGLTLCKQFKTGENYLHIFITNKIIESSYVSNRTREITSTFPLYLYSETKGQQTLSGFQTLTALNGDEQNQGPTRIPNLKP